MPKKAKKTKTVKEKRGFRMIRNLGLDTYEEFKKFIETLPGQPKLGPMVTLAMREFVDRHKKS